MTDIDVAIAPLVPLQAGDQLIAVRNGAVVRSIAPVPPTATLGATGNYADLQGLPDLSPSGLGAATAAQGLLAETAVQPAALLNFETTPQLNARDAANRNRATHTGSQPASTISDFAAAAAAAAPVQSVAGKAGAVTLAKLDVGLSNVDNTSDLAKPISTVTQAALDLKANAANLAAVATSGQYSALLGIPTTLAGYGIVDAATSAQGAKADTAVQPVAIASFETTTQLNARDIASRTRANHTGTQPSSSITGLAVVATSGAYADLSGRPTAAFTYDQTTEPVTPAVGSTWRERHSSGAILGEWEWSGSLWLGERRYASLYSGVSASATPTPVMSIYPKFPALLVGYSVNFGEPFSPQDSSNYWFFRHGGLGQSDWLSTIGQSLSSPTTLTKTLSTPVIITVPDPGDNRPTKVGSAGNLRSYQAITHYRIIR